MAKTTSPDKPVSTASFEDSLRELEAIVDAMEKGNLDLDPSLAAYQRGMELIKFCQDKLAAAENKIRVFDQGVLSETDLPDAD
ncbi:MAG: exodeoxyribonuclease VII small subunit [Georgfuchsia sp.]